MALRAKAQPHRGVQQEGCGGCQGRTGQVTEDSTQEEYLTGWDRSSSLFLLFLLLIEEWDKRQQHGELQPTTSALRKLPALLLLVIATPSIVMTAELLDDVVILVSEIFTVKCVHGITAFRNFPAPIAASSPAGS